MSQYLPKPKFFGRRVKVELDLLNYAKKKKAALKNVTSVDTLDFAKKN